MKSVCNGCNALINELHCIELSFINKTFAPLTSILERLSVVKYIQLQRNKTGGTGSWTQGLSDCSRLLYHWAIPPPARRSSTGYYMNIHLWLAYHQWIKPIMCHLVTYHMKGFHISTMRQLQNSWVLFLHTKFHQVMQPMAGTISSSGCDTR